MRAIFAAAIMALSLSLAGTRPAAAEVPEVKIVAQNGSNYLPLFVMQGHKLVEKQLAAKGLAATTVTWTRLAGPSAIVDSFLAGVVHFSGQGVPSTAALVGSHAQWNRRHGGVRDGRLQHLANDAQARAEVAA